MSKKNQISNVPSQQYYKIATVISDPEFKKKIFWLKNRFAEIGCHIPEEGFKSYPEYIDWNKKFWSTFVKMEQSAELKDKIQSITKGQSPLPWLIYEQVEQLKQEFLPPVYGEYFDDLLEEFGLDKNNKELQEFIEDYVFFGKKEFSTIFFNIVWKRDKPKDNVRLFLELLPHTKLEHIQNFWLEIEKDISLLPGYKKRYKKISNLERDLFIYYRYKKLLDETNKPARGKFDNIQEGIFIKLYLELLTKYPNNKDISLPAIRMIVQRMQKKTK